MADDCVCGGVCLSVRKAGQRRVFDHRHPLVAHTPTGQPTTQLTLLPHTAPLSRCPPPPPCAPRHLPPPPPASLPHTLSLSAVMRGWEGLISSERCPRIMAAREGSLNAWRRRRVVWCVTCVARV